MENDDWVVVGRTEKKGSCSKDHQKATIAIEKNEEKKLFYTYKVMGDGRHRRNRRVIRFTTGQDSACGGESDFVSTRRVGGKLVPSMSCHEIFVGTRPPEILMISQK